MANLTLKQYIDSPVINDGLEKLLGKNLQAFKANLINIVGANYMFKNSDPRSIVGAAVCATANHLSLTPSLGQAYIVPFKGQAQFQLGYRGLIQLAHRTGQYANLHAGKIFDGEIKSFSPVTGEPILGEKFSDNVVGYIAYFKLINGFEKSFYMAIADLEQHALTYSQSYAYDKKNGKKSSPWSTNFDAMACKTVLKLLLNKWGILSTEMATVIQADQSVVDKNTFTYVDNGDGVQERGGIYTLDIEPNTEEETADTTKEAEQVDSQH
ncbi:MAG: recombinase RecT [Selenomonadaceae bacterium]|nr:recombinase RecT [Selenomonadaceae bacterium]